MISDRDSLSALHCCGAGQHSGELVTADFRHVQGKTAAGRGALVAMVGEVSEIANEYARWAKPPRAASALTKRR